MLTQESELSVVTHVYKVLYRDSFTGFAAGYVTPNSRKYQTKGSNLTAQVQTSSTINCICFQ